LLAQAIDLGLRIAFLHQPGLYVIAVLHAIIDFGETPTPARRWIDPDFHGMLLAGAIMIQYHAGNIDSKNNQSISTPDHVKNTALQICHFILGHKKIRARIPVLAGLGVIVQHAAIGIVERSFQTQAWTIFNSVFENSVCHGLASCVE
jgi:hypothetical protein